MSFDLILPFLRPIAYLIQDPDVSEIMVNGSRRIFVERQGIVTEVPDLKLDERNLTVAVKNIARALADDVSEAKPILDSRLPDGSRVAASSKRNSSPQMNSCGSGRCRRTSWRRCSPRSAGTRTF
jgi:pilus assembly protein CpaF